ncbi:MAG: DUF1064 domain-containing protein [Parasphingorhabdus sp.]|uniref:DUF1064 domain-containing protein n=1 Tax=Parasphingorhabdus sp. TaxID=2709688 RepID=UPI0032979422
MKSPFAKPARQPKCVTRPAGETVSPFDAPTKKGNKYGAKKTDCQHGHKHDSRKEARRCNELHMLQRGNAISDLQNQPQFWFVIDGEQVLHENGRRVGYRADFQYKENGKTVVEDTKGGYNDNAWPLRRAIFRALFPDIDFRELK